MTQAADRDHSNSMQASKPYTTLEHTAAAIACPHAVPVSNTVVKGWEVARCHSKTSISNTTTITRYVFVCVVNVVALMQMHGVQDLRYEARHDQHHLLHIDTKQLKQLDFLMVPIVHRTASGPDYSVAMLWQPVAKEGTYTFS